LATTLRNRPDLLERAKAEGALSEADRRQLDKLNKPDKLDNLRRGLGE
jgi:hypothetical protein